MATYLITGCSQGLGLALVEHLLTFPSTTIIATTRSPKPNTQLQALIDSSSNRATHIELDITSDRSVASAVEQAKSVLCTRPLDILINNAALTATCISPFVGDATDLLTCFTSNVVGTQRVTTAFLPLVRPSAIKKIIMISSTQGSCTRAFVQPHSYAHAPDYKVSKAALNMLARQWALCLRDEGFCVLTVSPGHLSTQLGTFNGKFQAELPVEVGARATVKLVLEATVEDNGRFQNIEVEGYVRYRGEDVEF